MSQGKEQEQLIQDASTLLMFASTAARQQPPPEHGPANTSAGVSGAASNSGDIQRVSAGDGSETGGVLGHSSTEIPVNSVNRSRRPSQPILPAVTSPPSYTNAGYPGATSPPLLAPHRPGQNVLPQLKPFPISGYPAGSIDNRLSSHAYNYSPQIQPNVRPVYAAEPGQPAHGGPSASANLAVNQRNPSYAFSQASGAISGPYAQYYSGQFRQNLAPPQAPLRRQSVAQPPSGAETHAHNQHLRKTQSASPPEGAPKLVPLSPKPAHNDQPTRAPERSPLGSELPARGNFSVGHQRTPSQTTQRRPSNASSVSKSGSKAGSPSMASVPFARGINVESGKRSTDNAVIAAAALAAAAEVPFPPLKSKDLGGGEKTQVLGPPLEPSKPSAATMRPSEHQREVTVSARTTAEKGAFSSGISTGNVLKTEESVLTEPEDENQTEDEPISARGSFSTAEMPPHIHARTHLPNDGPKVSNPAPETTVQNQVADAAESAHTPEVKKRGSRPPKPPPLHTYKVGPDAGIIGCICGIEEDDGFTIQCDICFRWQHCSCMGYLTSEEVPEDEYKCYYCDEQKWDKIDAAACKKATLARLEMEKYPDSPGPEQDQEPEQEQQQIQEKDEKPSAKRKSSSSGHDDKHEKQDKNERHDKKRRKSDKDAKPPLERVPSAPDKRKSVTAGAASPNSASASAAAAASASKTVIAPEITNKENPLLEDGATAEQYQGLYYRLEENDYKTPAVRELVRNLGSKASPTLETMSHTQFKQLKFSKIWLPSHQKYLQERHEVRRSKGTNKTTVQVKTYSDNPKQKFVSVSKMGLFISEKTVSASGSAGTEAVIPPGTVVIEYLGEVDLWQSHVANKINQYSLWGTVKPKVAKAQLASAESGSGPVDLVLDARFVGNEARFIRRACATSANCEIRPVYIPQLQEFRFLVVTTRPIALGGDKTEEELRLPWEWDAQHPITQMLRPNSEGGFEDGRRFEDFTEEEKGYLISCVDTILSYVECGCNTGPSHNQCAIFKVKKATSYLLRSNRKASSLGGGFSKSKEELVMPKKPKQYISWKQRLVDRDASLLERSALAPQHLEMDLEPNAASEASPEAEASTAADSKDGDGDTKRCWVTFRQKLLSQHRNYTIANYKLSAGVGEVIDATTVVGELPSNVLAVPLTSEVLARIQSQVNEAFMPLQKTVSRHDVKIESTEVRMDAPVQEPMAGKEASPKEAQVSPDVAAAVPEIKPQVVKKLSFADYKKKMK